MKGATMVEKSEVVQMRVQNMKKLPSSYFASKKDLSIPSYRSAKPAMKKDEHGTFKSGRIVAVRYYE
jgi:hypothetical protein